MRIVAPARDSASSCSRVGGLVADFKDAADSLASSIGPPGSAREIAIPATNGARRTRIHSSSVKSLFVVMTRLYPLNLCRRPAWHVSRHGCTAVWVGRTLADSVSPPMVTRLRYAMGAIVLGTRWLRGLSLVS